MSSMLNNATISGISFAPIPPRFAGQNVFCNVFSTVTEADTHTPYEPVKIGVTMQRESTFMKPWKIP